MYMQEWEEGKSAESGEVAKRTMETMMNVVESEDYRAEGPSSWGTTCL